MTVECLDCQKRFQFEESLVVHQSVCMKHQEQRMMARPTCEQCGKTFKSMTRLRNHARTHMDYFDVTKEEIDRTLRTSLDMGANILESTWTSEVDVSTINRSLDISAVTCSDSLANSTYVCSSSHGANSTLTEDLLDVSAPFTEDKSPNNTYVLHKPTTDARSDKGLVFGLDQTYVCDGERRLSPDRTYLVPQMETDLTITGETEEIRMNQTHVITDHVMSDEPNDITRVISGHMTSKSSGLPVPSCNIGGNLNRKSKISTNKTKSPATGNGNRPSRGASIKSIRTLRNGRSKSRTPVKTNKDGATPSKNTRSKSRTPKETNKDGATPIKNTRSKSRSRTPTTARSSKYAARIPSGMSYSPFRMTPLSPKVTPLSKKKNLDVATYKCKKCGKTFNDKDQYDIHYVIHVRDTPVKCGIPSECYKKNNRKLQFSTPDKQAKSTPLAKPLFVCPHCHRAYQSERYLTSHIKVHFIDVPFACSRCDKRFKYAQSLRAHVITHKGEEENGTKDTNEIDSTKCKKRVSGNITELLQNMDESQKFIDSLDDDLVIRDLLELPYTCSSCSYKTNQPASLLKHMHTHSKPRPYQCDQCEKSYKTKANLDLHAKVHMIGKIRSLLSDRRMSVVKGENV